MTKKFLSFSLAILFAGTLFLSGADVSFAQNPPQNSVMVEFKNPLKYDTVEAVVGSFLTALQGIIVTLAIVFMSSAAFSTSRPPATKSRWSWARKRFWRP